MADKVSRVVMVTLMVVIILGVLGFGFCMKALACGAPQPIHGYAYWHPAGQPKTQFRISGARLTLRAEGSPWVEYNVITNPFGYYRFPEVLPCNNWVVTISHKWYAFDQAEKTVLVEDFPNDPAGVEVLFSATR